MWDLVLAVGAGCVAGGTGCDYVCVQRRARARDMRSETIRAGLPAADSGKNVLEALFTARADAKTVSGRTRSPAVDVRAAVDVAGGARRSTGGRRRATSAAPAAETEGREPASEHRNSKVINSGVELQGGEIGGDDSEDSEDSGESAGSGSVVGADDESVADNLAKKYDNRNPKATLSPSGEVKSVVVRARSCVDTVDSVADLDGVIEDTLMSFGAVSRRDAMIVNVIRSLVLAQQHQRREDIRTVGTLAEHVGMLDTRLRRFQARLSGLEQRFTTHVRGYVHDREGMSTRICTLEEQLVDVRALLREAQARDEDLRELVSERWGAGGPFDVAVEADAAVVHLLRRIVGRIRQNRLLMYVLDLVFRRVPRTINAVLVRPLLLAAVRFLRVEQVLVEEAEGEWCGQEEGDGSEGSHLRNEASDFDIDAGLVDESAVGNGVNSREREGHVDRRTKLTYDKRRAKLVLDGVLFVICELVFEKVFLPCIEQCTRPVLAWVAGKLFKVDRKLSSSTTAMLKTKLQQGKILDIPLDSFGSSKGPGMISIARACCTSFGDGTVLFARGVLAYYEAKQARSVDTAPESKQTSKQAGKKNELAAKAETSTSIVSQMISIIKKLVQLVQQTVGTTMSISVGTVVLALRAVAYFSTASAQEGVLLESKGKLNSPYLSSFPSFFDTSLPSGYAGTEKVVSFRTVSILRQVLGGMVVGAAGLVLPSNGGKAKSAAVPSGTPQLGSIIQLFIKSIVVYRATQIVHKGLARQVASVKRREWQRQKQDEKVKIDNKPELDNVTQVDSKQIK